MLNLFRTTAEGQSGTARATNTERSLEWRPQWANFAASGLRALEKGGWGDTQELDVFTDSLGALKEAVVRPSARLSAHELVAGIGPLPRRNSITVEAGRSHESPLNAGPVRERPIQNEATRRSR
jgi:hypothetical protein